MDPTLNLHGIRVALQRPLPGRKAQMTMAVQPRPGDRPDLPVPCPREGAVLILLYPHEGQLFLPLTRRTETVETHKGQISLPGGAREQQDESLAQTALRETQEELGVPDRDVEIIGALTPLYIPHSRFCVYPFVGYAILRPLLRPDPLEVAEAIEAPLLDLLHPSTRQIETHWRDGQLYSVPSYHIGPQKIWGATAMILAEFLALVREQQPRFSTASDQATA
jgi:8-oxo-dGTP pyrophosphatase MutT (NUDIX family)